MPKHIERGKQAGKAHYFSEYDDLPRFVSYFYQADLIRQTKAKDVLEVGVGNKTMNSYLKQGGVKVTSCDFDKSLKPDKVGDIRNLPFKDSEFDLAVAFEVLEHLPFEDFEKSVSELGRVSKKYVIISIPYSSLFFEVIFNSPAVNKLFGGLFKRVHLHLPYFFLKPQESPHHYWEMGRKGYSIHKIRHMLKKKFRIVKEVKPYLSVSHHFFVLKKR